MAIPIYHFAGRPQYFIPVWELLTKDQSFLYFVEGSEISLRQELLAAPKPF